MKIYRLHRGVRAAANYSGAMDAGGRWNPIGTPMLYTAQHLSLACFVVSGGGTLVVHTAERLAIQVPSVVVI